MLPQKCRGVHSRRQELSIVDQATVVHVDALEDLQELLGVLPVAQAPLQLLETDVAVTRPVQGLKDLL